MPSKWRSRDRHFEGVYSRSVTWDVGRGGLGVCFLEAPADGEDPAHQRCMVERRHKGQRRVLRAERGYQLKADDTNRAEERVVPADAEPAPQPPCIDRADNENYRHHNGGRFHKLRHFPPFQYEVEIILPHTAEH